MVLEIFDILFMKERIVGGREFYFSFEKMGGVDLLEELQNSQNSDIYKLSGDMIQKYGDGEQVPFLTQNISGT